VSAATATRFVDEVSPLMGVPPQAWRRWVAAVKVQRFDKVSIGGGLGGYNIRPRRLVEIGRAKNFRRIKNDDNGPARQECDFIAPWTEERFLSDPTAQYAVLVKSTRLYYDALRDGSIRRPTGMSIAGALAVLHAGGKGALTDWPKLFDETKALYEATKGIF
jgi:putative intracellular protease/amidase